MSFWDEMSVRNYLAHCLNLLHYIQHRGADQSPNEINLAIEQLYHLLSVAPRSPENEQEIRGLCTTIRLLEAARDMDNGLDEHDDDQKYGVDHELNSSRSAESEMSSSGTVTPTNSNYEVTIGNGNEKTNDNLDSFMDSRRKAVEGTIVSDFSTLPFLSDIVGLVEAKNALSEALVDPLMYPQWFSGTDLKPWKAVLLFGPPGTGKTALSQAIVKEIHAVMYQISSSDLISSWSGQSEKLIKELFDHAISQDKATVIFIDEVDSLCRTRSSSEDDGNRRVKTELLVQIQRLQSTTGVVLVCATNCPWDLDPAFLRRFEKKIYVGLPDGPARIALLKAKLMSTKCAPCVTVEWMSEQTCGFSGDDIRRFASELAYTQFRLFKENRHSTMDPSLRIPLTRNHVESVLRGFTPSVDEVQLARFQQYMNK